MNEGSQLGGSAGLAPEAAVDLLGLLAYAELISFFQLSADAELAPTLTDKAALAGLAAAEYEHFSRLRDRLTRMGIDAETAMRPFTAALDSWHEQTQPQSWLESLVKAYVGDGIAADFYRQLAEHADGETRELVHGVLSEGERAEFVVEKVRSAIGADPTLAGRLALWGRRLVGEALSQARLVAMDRPKLAALVAAGEAGADSADSGDVGRVFARLTDSHSRRLRHWD